MNERIKELIAEADRKCSETRGIYDEILAELIVEECRNVITEVYRNTPLELCGSLLTADEEIAKHFYGVEERKGWVCPKCGIDRTKDVCPKGHTAAITGDCPMTATAQSGVE